MGRKIPGEKFERLTFVRWDPNNFDPGYRKTALKTHHMAKRQGETFIYMGDIKQMPGHGVFISIKDDKVYTRLHTTEFTEVPEEDC